MRTIVFWSALVLACGVLLPRYYTAGRADRRVHELRISLVAVSMLVLLSLTLPWIPESRGGPVTGLALVADGDLWIIATLLCICVAVLLFLFARTRLCLKIGAAAHLLAVPLFFVAMLRLLPGTFTMTLADAAPVAAALLLLLGCVAALLLWHRLQLGETAEWSTRSSGIAAAVVILVFAYAMSTFAFLPDAAPAASLSPADAVQAVRLLPGVTEYLGRVPSALVDVDNENEESFSIHVYEVTGGHTATFGWYTVDRRTGEIEDIMGETSPLLPD